MTTNRIIKPPKDFPGNECFRKGRILWAVLTVAGLAFILENEHWHQPENQNLTLRRSASQERCTWWGGGSWGTVTRPEF